MRQFLVVWLLFVLSLPASAQPDKLLSGLQIGTGTGATLVMLHGDEGRGGDVSASFIFSAEVARRLPDVTVHALLRPGYQDPWGRTSPGENYGRRDQYTLENARIIADTLRHLRGDGPLLAIGHSGGAAQLALALALDPNIAEEAILVSCPCDLALWREMNPDWPADTLVRSVSPTEMPAPAQARLTVIAGEQDSVTPPALSESYVAHVQKAGTVADLVRVPEGDHSGNRALSAAWLDAIFAARSRVVGKAR